MKKRIENQDIILIVIIFLIPILLVCVIFSNNSQSIDYIVTAIINSLYGAFVEIIDLWNGEERTLREKSKDVIFRLGIYSFIIVLLTIIFFFNGIIDLIITFIITCVSYIINNLSIYFILEKK